MTNDLFDYTTAALILFAAAGVAAHVSVMPSTWGWEFLDIVWPASIAMAFLYGRRR